MSNRQIYIPSNALVQKWAQSSPIGFSDSDSNWYYEQYIANKSSYWGAQQERELIGMGIAESIKQDALAALYAIATGANDTREFYQDIETIRAALKLLPG